MKIIIFTIEKKGNGFELIIVVDRIEDVYERCKEKRCTIQEEIQTYPWEMRGFKVVDPDGYFLRVTSREESVQVGETDLNRLFPAFKRTTKVIKNLLEKVPTIF